jgi:membrane associated rhomboid family serine protease
MNFGRGSMLDESPVVKNLIVMNVVAFIAQMLVTQLPILDRGAMYQYNDPRFSPYQIVTSMFLHGGIGHIFFNMFTLFSFGTLLERVWGSKRFLIFYLVCGLAAGLAQQVVGNFGSVVGASGAIMGLMAAFAYLFPNTELMMMFIPVPIKAKYMVAIIIALDLFGGFNNHPADNVAHFAHLGGALAGFLIVLVWNKTNNKTFY